ncbi:ornithine carbamoyltransferase [Streptomyces ziwulingensis]|uniref:Ornithine carbamoyltransferase n=1 Tax=Streptomyces ziwulingensis TaxID=1045501 RepID=A0ABP9CIQ2_9ACTN
MRHLISLTDLGTDELAGLVRRAVLLARHSDRARAGGTGPDRTLDRRRIGIYFRKSSTRTRTAFWAAATGLGADVIAYGPDDLQLSTGETLQDTARTLGRYLDALVVRTNGDVAELRQLAAAGDLSVVNALTLDEHPTQAVADLTTLAEHFGDLSGRHVLCVGEGNSSARALALAAALTPGLRLTLLCPEGYEVPADHLELLAKTGDARLVTQVTDPGRVAGPVDAVYTSRWQTMGVPKADPDWLRAFDGFRVDAGLLARVGGPDTVFLHDLPAVRGQEVTDEVLDGERSLAWRQAFHKMTAAMAVLEYCLLDDFPGTPS